MRVHSQWRVIVSGLLFGFSGILLNATLTVGEPCLSPRQLESVRLESPLRKPGWVDVSADSWWTRDKRLHLAVSAGLVGLSFHLLHHQWHCEAEESRRLGISVTALVGVIKEVGDKRKIPPTNSSKDLVADGLGILLGVFLFTR